MRYVNDEKSVVTPPCELLQREPLSDKDSSARLFAHALVKRTKEHDVLSALVSAR